VQVNDCGEQCDVGIAIVDDEKGLVKMYEKLFSLRGVHICFVAYDGIEAVQKFKECAHKPHIILMDNRMPMMNGVEATKEILKIDSSAKIIFFSADVYVMDEAMRAGAFTFLKKPASLKDITDAVESGLGKAKA
jgi:two-component system, chemotaxis family, chemotaxis protein CheY